MHYSFAYWADEQLLIAITVDRPKPFQGNVAAPISETVFKIRVTLKGIVSTFSELRSFLS